jgi:RNA polymerase sigma-70 factor (ECF subfamily)
MVAREIATADNDGARSVRCEARMAAAESFDVFMTRLQAGDDEAASAVFRRYARRLIGLARSRLETSLQRKVDPEDLVQSVFRSFFERQADGQFEIGDWDGLWTMLTVITVRKCANLATFYHRERRNVRRESAPAMRGDESSAAFDDFLANEPTPDEAVILTETVEDLMRSLDERDRHIVAAALEGCSVPEIAEKVGYAQRTVRRTLGHVKMYLQRLRDAGSA